MPPAQAQARAHEARIVEWLMRHPPAPNGPDRCAHCAEPMADTDALPFLNGAGGNVWMHDRCHGPWMAERRAAAIRALDAFGLRPPTGEGGG